MARQIDKIGQRGDFLGHESHRLARVQADALAVAVRVRMHVGGKTIRLELLGRRARHGVIGQVEEEIDFVRGEGIEPLVAQLANELRVPVLPARQLAPTRGQVYAQPRERNRHQDQQRQPPHENPHECGLGRGPRGKNSSPRAVNS
jgi:hypothetical protein